MATVWILTSKHNDYDQHGEYFETAWAQKPTKEQLIKQLGYTTEPSKYVDDTIAHILKGGGRQAYENVWYFLRETVLN